MSDFLLEIGTEEIPARFLGPAKEGLYKLLKDALGVAWISSDNPKVYATPRRIAVIIRNVAEKQEDSVSIKYGPPYNKAFNAQGQPTPAATGFAKSQGVALDDLKKGIKDGVEFVTVEKKEGGKAAIDVLPGILKDVVSRIPFQKRMRWGGESFEFARPIQWLVALFGESVIEFNIADVKSGRTTLAHRFLSKGPIELRNPSEYIDKLRENFVVLDEEERLDVIRKGISKIEEETGGHVVEDESLVREILYITEYPYPLCGSFDEQFLAIPKEVLINVMKSHQKYIPLLKADNTLMPRFICFANTAPKEDANVIRGNEKVLRARLADARFFFDEDRKTAICGLYDRLSSIVWHVKLGTLKDKTERVHIIADCLALILNYRKEEKIERAVRLIKSDLLTHMVGEFPELQGTMGRIYAESQGEDQEVARAIEDHYLPSGGNGALPQHGLGSIMSIADKIDSLVSFFSIGINPTGNLDPFALRRQALGIMKIVIGKKLHVPLKELVEKAYESGSAIRKRVTLEETMASLLDFIITRFKFSMLEENHNQDFVESVLPGVSEDIYDGYLRLLALESQKSLQDFKRLMVGFRRVYNITKTLAEDREVEISLLREKEEKALFDLYKETKDTFFSAMDAKRYADALTVLVGFKETIDNFFDKVFVMDKNDAVKNNRLALLKKIKNMFLRYGDFPKIRVE
ncbi:MAG: glycine--tRNA ligase subunit beta [Syntrophobacterales bacterium]|jgi:glycyl-tRNA synthetase beta chain|nr:glycine--tRNA ligase subunit beta [Syntrophobacterales bacterium]